MFRFLPYILRSARRNKVRSVLTLVGVMVAVGVFAVLASIESSMNVTIDTVAKQTLLIVTEKDQW